MPWQGEVVSSSSVENPELTEAQVQRRTASARLAADHPWLAHIATGLVVLLLGLVTAALAAETVRGATRLGLYPADAPAAVLVPVGWLAGAVVGAVVLPLRRRWPVVTLAVVAVAAVLSLAVAGVLGVLGVVLAVAVRSVAAERGVRAGWAAGGVVLVVVSLAVLRWEDIGLGEILLWSDVTVEGGDPPVLDLREPAYSSGRRTWTLLLLVVMLLLGRASGTGLRARRLHARDLVERYAALARERDAGAALARSAERARIAREMHDIVAHSVSVMVALSDGARSALDRAPEASREALAELSRTGREALQDMRDVLGSLQDDEPAQGTPSLNPTEVDLGALVERFRVAGLPVTGDGLDTELPPDAAVRLAVVRIVGESLTNVLRHAPGASKVQVVLRRNDSELDLEILDTGGARAGAGGGSGRGLIGVRERVAHFGGRVDIGPRASGGWRVHVVLPVDGGQNGG